MSDPRVPRPKVEESDWFNAFNPAYLDRLVRDLQAMALDYWGCGTPPGQQESHNLACACTGQCSQRRDMQEAAELIDWIRRHHSIQQDEYYRRLKERKGG